MMHNTVYRAFQVIIAIVALSFFAMAIFSGLDLSLSKNIIDMILYFCGGICFIILLIIMHRDRKMEKNL